MVEPTAVERVSSDACTRSGAFALLLSVVLLLLIPYWLNLPKRNALRSYLTDRMNLEFLIEKLDDDPRWQNYKNVDATLESRSIAELMESSVVVSTSGTRIVYSEENTTSAKQERLAEPSGLPPGIRAYIPNNSGPQVPIGVPNEIPKALKPAAPTLGVAKPSVTRLPGPPKMISVTTSGGLAADELPQVADFLKKLNDSEMLSRSLQVSNYFNNSIGRWINKRNMLVYRNSILKSCTMMPLEVPHPVTRSPYVPTLYDEALLKCLSVEDVRELANFESPASVYNPPQFGEQVGAQIDVSPGGLPRDPYLASILTQVLLFFVIMYFSAFTREAASQTAFPSRGTLFGAFSSSRPSLLVLFVALWSPFLASLSIGFASRRWLLIVCSVFIFLAVLSSHLVLERKSYWSLLTQKTPSGASNQQSDELLQKK